MQPMFGSQPLMNFMMLISMLIPLFARIAECSWQFQFPTNYSRRQRPLLDQSQPITVQYKITITQLIALDEKQQEMCCKVWIDQKWTDEYLKWDLESDTNVSNQSSSDSSSSSAATEEENQQQQTTEFRPQWMSFRPGEIWTPDIAIDNSISVERENFDIKVYNDGSIWWSIPAITRTTCYIKTEQFPFDQQECDIVVGSWYYQPNEINLIVEGNATKMELKYAAENAQWQFLDSWILTEDEKHDTYDMVFRTLHFRIKFKRKSLYYCLILIVPYILISFVSLANFILPCESGEKIALGITVLLSQFVNLLNLVDLIPESSDSFPVLGLYYLVSMALCALSVILTVLILNIHFQADNSKRLPSYVRVLFLQYLRIFFLPGTKYEAFGKEKSGQKSSNKHPKSFMNFKFSRNKYHKEDSFDSDMMFGQLNCNWDNHAGNDRSFPNHNHNHLANSFASITQNNHNNHHTFTHNNNNNNLNHHHHHHRDPIGRQNRMPNGQLAESLLNHNSTFRLIEAAKGSILANGRQNACNEQDDSLNGRIQFSMSEVLSDIRDIMEALYESKTQEQQDASVAEEWRIVARVLDRILGLCYCATFFSVFAFLDYDMFT